MADSVKPNPTAPEQLDLGLYCSNQILSVIPNLIN